MPRRSAFPTPLLDAYLRERGLSEATVVTYAKHIRRALVSIGEISEGAVRAYDATLSVKMRENFRAAWRRFVDYAAKQNVVVASPPRRARPGERTLQASQGGTEG